MSKMCIAQKRDFFFIYKVGLLNTFVPKYTLKFQSLHKSHIPYVSPMVKN